MLTAKAVRLLTTVLPQTEAATKHAHLPAQLRRIARAGPGSLSILTTRDAQPSTTVLRSTADVCMCVHTLDRVHQLAVATLDIR